MALPVDLLLSRTELPQDGARLNPAHPLAGRFVTAYLPGVSSDNLGFGGPGGIVGNAHSRSAIPAGPTLRLSGSGANATTSRSYGPTPSYPLTMVVVCRQSNNTTTSIAACAAASAISGSYYYIGGGSSTILTLGARNAFGTALALNVTVPADSAGNQAIGQDMVIVAQSLSASDHRLCVNSSAVATATTNIGSMVAWDRLILGQTSGTTGLDVAAVLVAHGGTALTDAQMRQLASHPREVWELFEPQRLPILVPSAASGYTLTADTASFTLTGVATGLIAARSLTADQQSYSLTGVAANLLRGFSLTADQASFALSGVDAGLTTARLLTAAQQTYTLTGVDAGLTYTPAGAYTLTADVGTFTLTGNAAGLNYYKLTADTVAFAFTGNDAALTYTPLGAYTLTADSGSFALTGGAAALSGSSSLRGRVVRRRKTKTPLPIAEDVIETPAVTQSLISSDAMKLLVEKAGDNARQAVKVARVKAEKNRIEIQKAEEAAIEKALFEWF